MKLTAVVCIALMVSVLLGFAQEEKLVLSILVLKNELTTGASDALCETIRKTVDLVLRLMGRYSIQEPPQDFSYEDSEQIGAYAEDNGIDNVIFGSVGANEEGGIVIRLSVYDRFEGRVTITDEEVAESIFDTFDKADELVASVIGGFSGIRVAFGALDIINRGERGRYTVYIDGERLGENLESIPKILTGTHTVSIETMYGREALTLFDEGVDIAEGRTAEVRFALPYILAGDADRLAELDRAIMRNWEYGEGDEVVSAAFDEAAELTEWGTAESGLGRVRAKFAAWQRRYENRGTRPAFFEKKPLRGGLAAIAAEHEKAGPLAYRSASVAGDMAEMVGDIYSVPRETITLDGRAYGWPGLVTAIRDDAGDVAGTGGIRGADITVVGLARDEEYLYLRLSVDAVWNKSISYSVEFEPVGGIVPAKMAVIRQREGKWGTGVYEPGEEGDVPRLISEGDVVVADRFFEMRHRLSGLGLPEGRLIRIKAFSTHGTEGILDETDYELILF